MIISYKIISQDKKFKYIIKYKKNNNNWYY